MIDLRANCVAHYKLNDNAANTAVLDSRGFSHGTAQRNTNLLHTSGKVNGALTFNGYSDCINTNKTFQKTFRDSFTITGWWYFSQVKAYQKLFEEFEYNSPQCGIWLAYNNIDHSFSFTYKANSEVGDSSSFIPQINTWYMLTIIVTKLSESSAKISFYINSELKKETISNVIMSNFVSNNNFDIGAGGTFLNDFFCGLIDNVMLFDKALSQTERVDFLYNNGNGTEQLTDGDFIRVYRGQDGIFDYENPAAEMELEDEQVFIGNQELPADTIWHYIRRRVAACCSKESPDSPSCIAQINSDGDMFGHTPNTPIDITAEGLADAKVKLQWRYIKLEEEVAPTGFHIYIDSGSGFDFENPDATIAYHGGGPKAGEFDWTSEELVHGEIYRFCVRSYRTGAGESQNTNFVTIITDSEGPDAIIDLITSVEEI